MQSQGKVKASPKPGQGEGEVKAGIRKGQGNASTTSTVTTI